MTDGEGSVSTTNLRNSTLRVSEAKPQDAGRAIARIDPQTMSKLEIQIGDIIQIHGKKTTVAKAMPTYPEDRGKSVIQMDGLLRDNAQVSLDERVSIEKTAWLPAEKVVLSP